MRISDWSSDVCSSDLLRHGAAGTRCQIALRVMHQETVAKRARDKMLSDDLAAPLRHLLPHVAIPVLRCRRIEFADHVTKLFCRRDDVTRHRSTLDLIAVERSEERRGGKECVSTGKTG